MKGKSEKSVFLYAHKKHPQTEYAYLYADRRPKKFFGNPEISEFVKRFADREAAGVWLSDHGYEKVLSGYYVKFFRS